MPKTPKPLVADRIPGRPQDEPSYRQRAYALVARIPPGRVMSYGLVARVLGAGYDARAIGNIMYGVPEKTDAGLPIPWHRVINAQGGCSTAGATTPPDLQQRLLEAEGIVFSAKGRCTIGDYLWHPPEYETAESEAASEDQPNPRQNKLF
jgi:methylated-DNA-protein-cysteine methyltransferase related protein